MPTPLRQSLTLLTLASLTLLPPLTMAQTTAPLPPAEPMAQEVGALWDPATITPLKLLNIDLFSRSELGQPVVVQPVIPYPSVGGGSFAYCLETLDGLQSRLVEGIVCTDGFTLVRSLEMTFDEALALQAQFDISSGPAPVRRPTEFSWATFWTDTVVDPIHDLTETELSRRADWYDAVYPAAQDHELKLWLPAPADEEATDPTVVADPTNQRPVLADIVGVAGVAMTTGAGTDDAEANARFTLDGLDPATEFSTAYYCNAVASDEDNSDNPTDGTTDTIDPHDLSKENVQKAWHLLHTEELDKRLWIAFLEANAEIRATKKWWFFWGFEWDLAGESYQDRSVTLYGCDDVFEAADRLHEAICYQWSKTPEMRTSMVGSAKSDIDGYEELVAELRATAAKHAKELETGLKEAVRLNPAADILFTLDDLANKDASIWDVPTIFVAGVPYISGGVYKSGTKILRTWKKAPNRVVTNAGQELRDLTIKGWRKGKGAPHFTKHGQGMGFNSLKEYTEAAKQFQKMGGKVTESKVGNLLFKYDHATERILIVSAKERTIVTFYKANSGIRSLQEAMAEHWKVLQAMGH